MKEFNKTIKDASGFELTGEKQLLQNVNGYAMETTGKVENIILDGRTLDLNLDIQKDESENIKFDNYIIMSVGIVNRLENKEIQ